MTIPSRTMPPRIMLVDDDPGIRLTLECIIEDEGYLVVTAEDGHQALELARQTPFDLVFMDILMPGINGVETHELMKSIRPECVVVMMTGFALEGLIKEALDHGAYAVVYKPFQVQHIVDIISAVLKTTFVMVVGDLEADRETLCAVLEENGYLVFSAESGSQAVSMAAERHYKAILMDVRMPGMDGLAACEEIRRFDPEVKVIIVTGYDLEGPAREALIRGAYSVITKPAEPEELLTLMKSIAGSQGTP